VPPASASPVLAPETLTPRPRRLVGRWPPLRPGHAQAPKVSLASGRSRPTRPCLLPPQPDRPEARARDPAPHDAGPVPRGVRAASFCSGYGARACAPGPPQNWPHSLPPPRQSHLWRYVLRARPEGSPRRGRLLSPHRATAWRCTLHARSEKPPGHVAPTTRSVPSEKRPRAPDWDSLRSGLS